MAKKTTGAGAAARLRGREARASIAAASLAGDAMAAGRALACSECETRRTTGAGVRVVLCPACGKQERESRPGRRRLLEGGWLDASMRVASQLAYTDAPVLALDRPAKYPTLYVQREVTFYVPPWAWWVGWLSANLDKVGLLDSSEVALPLFAGTVLGKEDAAAVLRRRINRPALTRYLRNDPRGWRLIGSLLATLPDVTRLDAVPWLTFDALARDFHPAIYRDVRVPGGATAEEAPVGVLATPCPGDLRELTARWAKEEMAVLVEVPS